MLDFFARIFFKYCLAWLMDKASDSDRGLQVRLLPCRY